MRLTLRLSPSLQIDAGEALEYEVPGTTLGECFHNIRNELPEIKEKIWKGERLNPQILFFHNNTVVRESSFSDIVRQNDVLDVIPAIEGG